MVPEDICMKTLNSIQLNEFGNESGLLILQFSTRNRPTVTQYVLEQVMIFIWPILRISAEIARTTEQPVQYK